MVEKNSNGLSALRKSISEVLELLGSPTMDELDKKLLSVPTERYSEEIDRLIDDVPVEKRDQVKRFLDTRHSFILMREESGNNGNNKKG